MSIDGVLDMPPRVQDLVSVERSPEKISFDAARDISPEIKARIMEGFMANTEADSRMGHRLIYFIDPYTMISGALLFPNEWRNGAGSISEGILYRFALNSVENTDDVSKMHVSGIAALKLCSANYFEYLITNPKTDYLIEQLEHAAVDNLKAESERTGDSDTFIFNAFSHLVISNNPETRRLFRETVSNGSLKSLIDKRSVQTSIAQRSGILRLVALAKLVDQDLVDELGFSLTKEDVESLKNQASFDFMTNRGSPERNKNMADEYFTWAVLAADTARITSDGKIEIVQDDPNRVLRVNASTPLPETRFGK